MTRSPLIDALRAAFAAHADAENAAPMQAYMKSALPFYGIAAPLRRRLTAEAVKEHPCADTAALTRTMRTAMLAQRSLDAAAFDAVLLYDCILPSIGGGTFAGEFFIRKGIGWALRERSYAAPEEVQAFCREYASQLAPLTVREALKVIHEKGKHDG